ncbi:MAG: CbtA family protein [Rhizobiaceae bacterium]|nr:CbtA family protein [Rhizobiaceae bacterium]
MAIFRNTVFVAVVAGLFAGLVMAAMQSFTTVPLILQAETFENAGEAAPAAAATEHAHDAAAPTHSHDAAAPAHEHDPDAWSPADGFERTFYTVAANVVTSIGFALILLVASELTGGIASWRQGVLWGLAGFAVFTLAPGLGLPPELPAMPAAELGDRQLWWWFAVIATAAGLALMAFRGTVVWSLVGLALIVVPHLVGAPQPVSHESPIPENLHHQFVVITTVTNLVFWVVLGGLAGALRDRFFASADNSLQGKLA